MNIIANIILYGVFVYFLYEYTIKAWDPWNAFTVVFVIGVAVLTSLMPSLHASKTSPGEYPYDDD